MGRPKGSKNKATLEREATRVGVAPATVPPPSNIPPSLIPPQIGTPHLAAPGYVADANGKPVLAPPLAAMPQGPLSAEERVDRGLLIEVPEADPIGLVLTTLGPCDAGGTHESSGGENPICLKCALDLPSSSPSVPEPKKRGRKPKETPAPELTPAGGCPHNPDSAGDRAGIVCSACAEKIQASPALPSAPMIPAPSEAPSPMSGLPTPPPIPGIPTIPPPVTPVHSTLTPPAMVSQPIPPAPPTPLPPPPAPPEPIQEEPVEMAAAVIFPSAPNTGGSLGSILDYPDRGPWGDPKFRGNFSGRLVKDLITHFKPQVVFDPMAGSGTTGQVCAEMGVASIQRDLSWGPHDENCAICAPVGTFGSDLIIWHPPYAGMIDYTPYDQANQECSLATGRLKDFYEKVDTVFLRLAKRVLVLGGHMAVLIGDWRHNGKYHHLLDGFLRSGERAGLDLESICIKIQNRTSSAGNRYTRKEGRAPLIPILHEYLVIWRRPGEGE